MKDLQHFLQELLDYFQMDCGEYIKLYGSDQKPLLGDDTSVPVREYLHAYFSGRRLRGKPRIIVKRAGK